MNSTLEIPGFTFLIKRPKIGLALGGGGARGLAHIGVLKVLEREQIRIDLITGTSIGSIVGAMYAQNPEVDTVEKRFRAFLASSVYQSSGLALIHKKQAAESLLGQITSYLRNHVVLNLATYRKSLVSKQRLDKTLAFLINDGLIEDTVIPFAPVASDVMNAKECAFHSGPLFERVAASCALPGYLPPVEVENHLFVDGSVTSPVPIDAAFEMGADIVIAVDVSEQLEVNPTMDNVIDIIFRTHSITSRRYHDIIVQKADLLIQPQVGGVHWSDFHLLDRMINAGFIAANALIQELAEIRRKQNHLGGIKRTFYEIHPC